MANLQGPFLSSSALPCLLLAFALPDVTPAPTGPQHSWSFLCVLSHYSLPLRHLLLLGGESLVLWPSPHFPREGLPLPGMAFSHHLLLHSALASEQPRAPLHEGCGPYARSASGFHGFLCGTVQPLQFPTDTATHGLSRAGPSSLKLD